MTQSTLTEREAWTLLDVCDCYFATDMIEQHVDGKHRTEVVARAMESDGKFALASELMTTHGRLVDFANGDYSRLRLLEEAIPVTETVLGLSKNTKFSEDCKGFCERISRMAQLFKSRGEAVDWEASADILRKVKTERFPESLTMVEKMTNWQRADNGREPRER